MEPKYELNINIFQLYGKDSRTYTIKTGNNRAELEDYEALIEEDIAYVEDYFLEFEHDLNPGSDEFLPDVTYITYIERV